MNEISSRTETKTEEVVIETDDGHGNIAVSYTHLVGSGTTSLAAKNLGRNSIGYEINKDFEPIIREKLGVDQLRLGDDTKVVFAEDEIGNNSSFDQLPYIFSDPHRMDKKVDVKKLQFGSKIDPVSYTHLDVYKRQILFNSICFSVLERKNISLILFSSSLR